METTEGGRKPPTASERKRRTEQVELAEAEAAEHVEQPVEHVEQPVEHDEQAVEPPEQPAEPTEQVDSSEEEDEVSEPCPGGPYDTSILKSFRSHIAFSIWDGQVIIFRNLCI